MALIDFELKWESTYISDKVISYSREHNICTGVSLLNFTVPLTDTNNYSTWDEIIPYEDGDKKGEFFICELERNAPKGEITIRCQDGSKRLVDYFIPSMYEIQDGDYSRPWVEVLLNAAGVSYSFSTGSNGVMLAGHNMGYDSAYGLIMTLLQQSGWYMYFNTSNTVIIGDIARDSSTVDTFNKTDILSIDRNISDKMLRNKVIVYGNGIQVEEEITTPWNYDEDDDRTVVIANPYFRSEAPAREMASKLLDEFARLNDEKEVTVTGFRDIELGDKVMVKGNVFYGTGKVTSLVSKLSDKGAITTLILDERCPRLFTYYSPYYEGVGTYVYVGTWGDGVWRKPLWSSTWEEYNQGLTNLYIKDLYVKNGVLLAVANNGFAYKSDEISGAWIRVWHGDFEDNDGVIYGEVDVDATACTIDLFNNLVVGYNYSGGTSDRSWMYTFTGSVVEIAKENVTTSGVDDYLIYDIASYDNRKNIVSCEGTTASGIIFHGVDDMYNFGPSKQVDVSREHSIYNNYSFTSLPQSLTDDVVVEEGVDYDTYEFTKNSSMYGHSLERNDDTKRYHIYTSKTGGWGSTFAVVRHVAIDESSSPQVVEEWSKQINSLTLNVPMISDEDLFTYYDDDNMYYVVHSYDINKYTHFAINRSADTSTRTEHTITDFTSFESVGEWQLLANGKLYRKYADDVISDKYGLYAIDMVAGTGSSVAAKVLDNSPFGNVYGVDIRNYKSGVSWLLYYAWYGGNDEVTLTMVEFSDDGTTEHDLYTTPNITTATATGYDYLISANNNGVGSRVLGYIGLDANIFDDGKLNPATRDLATTVYIEYTDLGVYEETIYEDIVYKPAGATKYERDYLDSATYGSEVIPINSRFTTGFFRFKATTDTLSLFNIYGDLQDSFTIAGTSNVTGICPILDDVDDTLYVRVLSTETSNYELWGITTLGTVTKKFDVSIDGVSSYTEDFIANANHLNYEDKFLLFTNYTINDREGDGGKVLNHVGEVFSPVLYPANLSKVEISKPNPTIVYNVTDGATSTNVYYSFVVGSGDFTSLLAYDLIYDIRMFDANYSGGGGSLARYMTYTTPSGIYMLDTANMEGESTRVVFSESPRQLEVANYGLNPYFFATTSDPQQFYQRNPLASGFTNMSISLPSGLITVIRLDDNL